MSQLGGHPARAGRLAATGSLADGLGGFTVVSCCLQEICANEPIQVTVEDALGVPHLGFGPVVLDELVWMEHIAPDRVAAEAHRDAPAFPRQLGLALLHRLFC